MSHPTGIVNPWEHHPIHTMAWWGCLSWASQQPEIVERFVQETGETYLPPADGLSRMIDEATGADVAVVQRFADWVTEAIYGTPESLDAESP